MKNQEHNDKEVFDKIAVLKKGLNDDLENLQGLLGQLKISLEKLRLEANWMQDQ